jgi:hypothetical protein
MVCNIEDADYEINSQPILWNYGSGFPKTLNISKQIDKLLGNKRGTIKYKSRPESSSGTMMVGCDSRPWIEESRKTGFHEVPDNNPISIEAQKMEWMEYRFKTCS